MFNRLKALMHMAKYVADPDIQRTLQLIQVKKQKEQMYKELISAPLKYEIIKDFIEAARAGVVVKFTVQGIPVEIRKDGEYQESRFTSPEF